MSTSKNRILYMLVWAMVKSCWADVGCGCCGGCPWWSLCCCWGVVGAGAWSSCSPTLLGTQGRPAEFQSVIFWWVQVSGVIASHSPRESFWEPANFVLEASCFFCCGPGHGQCFWEPIPIKVYGREPPVFPLDGVFVPCHR